VGLIDPFLNQVAELGTARAPGSGFHAGRQRTDIQFQENQFDRYQKKEASPRGEAFPSVGLVV
jgi:hypothetical protein